jgi:hypothetical protein
VHEGIGGAVVELGDPGVTETVFRRSLVVEEGLEKADEELRVVLIVVGRLGVVGFGSDFSRYLSSVSREAAAFSDIRAGWLYRMA